MRVFWAADPSTRGTVLTPIESSWVGDLDDVVKVPRARFARVSRTAAQSVIMEIDPPSTDETDLGAFVIAYRFPWVDITAGNGNDYTLKLTPLVSTGGASITDSIARIDAAISGASPFAKITTQTATEGDFAALDLTNRDDTFFKGWIVAACTLTAAGTAAATTMEITLGVQLPDDDYIVDIGFCGWMRTWESLNLDDTSSFSVSPIDPSVKQFSDGGELFATDIAKRRNITFDIKPSDEAAAIISADPYAGGVMTLADQIGTTKPSFWVPDEARALSPTMNIFGTVRDWSALVHRGNNRWSMNGLVIDELM